MTPRQPLSQARIVEAAVAVADSGGIAAISMRNIGRELGVEAMSLYHHVANKDALLDTLMDRIFAAIELPNETISWREGMQLRARSAREVLVAHPWALSLIDSRQTPGPALLRHHDAVIGCLLRGGFSIDQAARAFSVIDAYVYGFALTERNLPFDPAADDGAVDVAMEVMPLLAAYPYLTRLVRHLTGSGTYRFSDEFDRGLDIILDELGRQLG